LHELLLCHLRTLGACDLYNLLHYMESWTWSILLLGFSFLFNWAYPTKRCCNAHWLSDKKLLVINVQFLVYSFHYFMGLCLAHSLLRLALRWTLNLTNNTRPLFMFYFDWTTNFFSHNIVYKSIITEGLICPQYEHEYISNLVLAGI